MPTDTDDYRDGKLSVDTSGVTVTVSIEWLPHTDTDSWYCAMIIRVNEHSIAARSLYTIHCEHRAEPGTGRQIDLYIVDSSTQKFSSLKAAQDYCEAELYKIFPKVEPIAQKDIGDLGDLILDS